MTCPHGADEYCKECYGFGDPRIQMVYDILCDDDEGKPSTEHWEGWKARRIIEALDIYNQQEET